MGRIDGNGEREIARRVGFQRGDLVRPKGGAKNFGIVLSIETVLSDFVTIRLGNGLTVREFAREWEPVKIEGSTANQSFIELLDWKRRSEK